MSDAKVYAPEIPALFGTASHFCEVVVLGLRTVLIAGVVLGRGSRRPSRALSLPAHFGGSRVYEQLLYRNVQQFRGGLVLKAHRLLHHSTLGLRVIQKREEDACLSDASRTEESAESRYFMKAVGSACACTRGGGSLGLVRGGAMGGARPIEREAWRFISFSCFASSRACLRLRVQDIRTYSIQGLVNTYMQVYTV